LPEYADKSELHQCDECDRKFRREAFIKHVKICKKVFVEKRKTFDSKKARLTDEQQQLAQKQEWNDQSNIKIKSNISKKPQGYDEKPLKKIPKWKMQSEQFRKALNLGVIKDDSKNKPNQIEENEEDE